MRAAADDVVEHPDAGDVQAGDVVRFEGGAWHEVTGSRHVPLSRDVVLYVAFGFGVRRGCRTPVERRVASSSTTGGRTA